MSELKKCPFCGGEPTMIGSDNIDGKPYYFITCYGCFASAKGGASKEEAAANWNRRPEEDETL